ncbi:MAG: surface lipoprotein assembly modifier [Pseudomonadota bacterium]
MAISMACAGWSQAAQAQVAPAPPLENTVQLTPVELFAFADRAIAAGDFATAETAYRALSTNPDLELRTEARFRLAMMLADRLNRHRDAAIELRKILDEKPDAQRVRVELARMQLMIGNIGQAEREFRAAQARGLPADVERLVRFYANALSATKPLGASLEVALAPDSNINRATRSDTLGTIIGDFDLSEDAKAQSGLGLALRGQGYYRQALGQEARLLVRLSGSADIYRQSQFNDMAVSLQAGPEVASGKDRISFALQTTWRWFGQQLYSSAYGATADWRHPLGQRSQLNVEASAQRVDYRPNPLQDGASLGLAVGIDHAFSQRFGGGIQLQGQRMTARDPGYALASGGVSAYLFRELGPTTLALSFGYTRLEADERLFLYPQRRQDDRFSTSLSATFRQVRIGPFAPLLRLRYERNKSTVEIYDFNRVAGEAGLSLAL